MSKMSHFWRWFTKPTLSLAEGCGIAATIGGLSALKQWSGWPWGLSLLVTITVICVIMFGWGFVGTLIRRRHD